MKFYHNLIKIFLILNIILFSQSCKTERGELEQKIFKSLRDDNEINKEEWHSIVDFIIKNPKSNPNLYVNGTIDKVGLKNFILEMSKRRRNIKKQPKIYTPTKKESKEKPKVNIFIENSGSMDGYIRGITEFEAALSDLLVQIKYKYNQENLDINFINTKIYPSKVDEVKTFVEALDPSRAPYKTGNRSISKLNEILETILDSTKQDEISILISDCIYSLDKDRDTEGALEYQKSLTKGAFLEKSKDFSFSTIILKMNSKFNGNYYDKNNNRTLLTNSLRPYYIWVFGKENLITNFLTDINLNSLKGYENSYALLSNDDYNDIFYTILRTTNTIGRFKPANKRAREIKEIKDITYQNGIFQFSIAIDLSKIPVEDSYVENIKNYEDIDGASIVAIEKMDRDKLDRNDFNKISDSNTTHVITVQLDRDYYIEELHIKLSKKMPSWVIESNSIDDTNIKSQLSKTFGLSYLIEGVTEAYQMQKQSNESYLDISITIKN